MIFDSKIKFSVTGEPNFNYETSAKLRPLAELMSAASLALQRHMSDSNLSPRNISNIPAGKIFAFRDFNKITGFAEVSLWPL